MVVVGSCCILQDSINLILNFLCIVTLNFAIRTNLFIRLVAKMANLSLNVQKMWLHGSLWKSQFIAMYWYQINMILSILVFFNLRRIDFSNENRGKRLECCWLNQTSVLHNIKQTIIQAWPVLKSCICYSSQAYALLHANISDLLILAMTKKK